MKGIRKKYDSKFKEKVALNSYAFRLNNKPVKSQRNG